MTLLPDSYLSPLHLPFNTACLQQRFELQSPDADPGGEQGVWLLLRNGELWMQGSAEQPVLPGRLPSGILPKGSEPLYLGTWDGQPCRLLALEEAAFLPPEWIAVELSDWYGQIPIEFLSLGGAALRFCIGREAVAAAPSVAAMCSDCPRSGESAVPSAAGYSSPMFIPVLLPWSSDRAKYC